MPVAIRKRSWEEHVTHPSGIQYSYDDLDLVCCHGVDSEGPWMEAGASKHGRRTRCASMPEGCHQLPTETPSVWNGNTESGQFKLMENNAKVNLQKESVHSPCDIVCVDISQRAYESGHLETTNMGNFGGLHCKSNRKISSTNISCATDSSTHSEKTINPEGETSPESQDICNDGNVFKSPHISHEEQQCISIFLNNGLTLSESDGEHPGHFPNHQETKESHTEGYRPPEMSEATLTSSSAIELDTQTDLPEVEEDIISTFDHAGRVLDSSVVKGGNVMLPANKSVETVETLVGEGRNKGVTERWSADSHTPSHKPDGLKDLETVGLQLHSSDSGGDMQDHQDCSRVLGQAYGFEIPLLEKNNFEMTALTGLQEEGNRDAENSNKAAKGRYGPILSSDICLTGQCCCVTVNVISEKINIGYSKEDPTVECADQSVEKIIFLREPMENMDQSSVSRKMVWCEDQNLPQQVENSCLKLDTIPEVSHIEPSDAQVYDPEKNTQNPAVQHSCMNNKHAPTEQHIRNLPPCSAEINCELSPEEPHGNQTSGHYSESPVSEVTDGQKEDHRPQASVSTMEETDEAEHTAIYSSTHLVSPVLDATNEPGDLKEDNVVKVRVRKVRLFSFYFCITVVL